MDIRWREGPSTFLVYNEVPSMIQNEIVIRKNNVVKPQGAKDI